jgi:CBS domain containing-hemolysin-like protein
VLETIFRLDPTRSARLFHREAIREVGPGEWNVTGMTSLRRLAKFFDVNLPESRNVTVAGVTHEVLERLPVAGDEFVWGPFRFHVLEVPERGLMTVQLKWNQPREASE